MLLSTMLQRLIVHGQLTLVDASGRIHHLGRPPGPRVTIRLADRRLQWQLALMPDSALGDAYMDGRLVVEEGSIYDLLDMCAINTDPAALGLAPRLLYLMDRLLRRWDQYNPIGRSRRNAAYHYDLDGQLYEWFLDSDRQYSCAYFPRSGMDRDQAQAAKKRHIAAKLLLRPGLRVLDIGSGLALSLAADYGCDVTGLTLSTEQHAYATARAARRLCGPRQVRAPRLSAAGRPVGPHRFRRHARACRRQSSRPLFRQAARAARARRRSPGAFDRPDGWPGGDQPMGAQADLSRRLHSGAVGSALRRGAAAALVFQIQLARARDAVPLTRDYVTRADARRARLEPVAAE
jgi:hypothetical protein